MNRLGGPMREINLLAPRGENGAPVRAELGTDHHHHITVVANDWKFEGGGRAIQALLRFGPGTVHTVSAMYDEWLRLAACIVCPNPFSANKRVRDDLDSRDLGVP